MFRETAEEFVVVLHALFVRHFEVLVDALGLLVALGLEECEFCLGARVARYSQV